MKSTILEISVEERAFDLLRQSGAEVVKFGQGGLPDRLVLWGSGRHFWIEFKKEKTGRLRLFQKQWRAYLTRMGDRVYVVDKYSQVEEIVAVWEMTHGPADARRFS